MNRMTKYSIISLALFVLIGCATLKDSDSVNVDNLFSLTVVQGTSRIEINNSDTTISINKEPLTLEFVCHKYDEDHKLFYSAKIAATTDKAEFDKVDIGPLPKDHPFFGYATGKSGGRAEEYETMYIDNNGHHYIIYSSEDEKRATLLKKLDDEYLRLSWTINSFTENGTTTPIDSTTIEQLYMLYFQDLNLNDTIESGELKKLRIMIK